MFELQLEEGGKLLTSSEIRENRNGYQIEFECLGLRTRGKFFRIVFFGFVNQIRYIKKTCREITRK